MEKSHLAAFLARLPLEISRWLSNKEIWLILVAAILARLPFLNTQLWWDSGVYIGMAKWIWSFGKVGLWEHIRPPLLPAAIGLGSSLGIDSVLFSKLLSLGATAGLIFLTYAITSNIFGKREGLIAAAIVAFSPAVFQLSLQSYTEIPATALALLALLLLFKSPFASGLLLGAAFLTKFPAGLFAASAFALVFLKRKFKAALPLAVGIAIPISLYLIANVFAYGSALAPLADAQKAISQATGCTILRAKPWWYYFEILAKPELPFLLLFPIGIALAIKTRNPLGLALALALVLALAYFLQLPCREHRYLILWLPALAAFSAKALALPKKAFPGIFLIVLLLSGALALNYQHQQQKLIDLPWQSRAYFNWFKGFNTEKEIWTANPVHAAFADLKFQKIYYPIYHAGQHLSFFEYLKLKHGQIGAVALDNCGGGVVCLDAECEAVLNATIDFLNKNFEVALDIQARHCWFKIWTSRKE